MQSLCPAAISPSRPNRPIAATPITIVSVGKSLRHVSPRKFQQIQQQQRAVALRNMPLSPLSNREKDQQSTHARQDEQHNDHLIKTRESVPWHPVWQHLSSFSCSETFHSKSKRELGQILATMSDGASLAASTTLGSLTLESWLQAYEQDLHTFESLEKFIQVKLPEALKFYRKLKEQQRALSSSSTVSSRFHIRFRIAIFAHLMEQTITALSESPSLAHVKPMLLQARQELFRAIFADYDQGISRAHDQNERHEDTTSNPNSRTSKAKHPPSDNDSDSEKSDDDDSESELGPTTFTTSRSFRYGPVDARPLHFFLSKVPYTLKLEEDSAIRAIRFKCHQAVMRRIVQSMYRSLGSVFHAWRLLVRQRKEERLNHKGAQLTAMVVLQRGLIRSVFVEWSKATLRAKIRQLKSKEINEKKQYEKVLADLHREIFLLKEKNHELEKRRQLPIMRTALDEGEQLKPLTEEDEDDDLADTDAS